MQKEIETIMKILKGSSLCDRIREINTETTDNELKNIYEEYREWLSKEEKDDVELQLVSLPSSREAVIEILCNSTKDWKEIDVFEHSDLLE